MVIYIYLIASKIAINCNSTGCLQISMTHLNFLITAGVLESIFEIPFLITIYKKVRSKAATGDDDSEEDN